MDFLWVGNHPGVDLCNTVPLVGGDAVELLTRPGDLRSWLAAAGVAAGPQPSEPTLAWVRRLRDALRGVLTAGADRRRPLAAFNSVLAELPAVAAVDEDGRLMLRAAGPQAQLRLDVAAMAIDACGLPPERVRQCANPRCVLLFYDVSKSASRRWHDMATCGNQAKAAAHHARGRAGG